MKVTRGRGAEKGSVSSGGVLAESAVFVGYFPSAFICNEAQHDAIHVVMVAQRQSLVRSARLGRGLGAGNGALG